jgi:hypothetical protein
MTTSLRPTSARLALLRAVDRGEVQSFCRYAWEDRYPPGTDLRQKARDSVIRYANHFGLSFRWYHDMAGERWRSVGGPNLAPSGVHGWRSEVIITGLTAAGRAVLDAHQEKP